MGETPPRMVFVWEKEAGKEAAGAKLGSFGEWAGFSTFMPTAYLQWLKMGNAAWAVWTVYGNSAYFSRFSAIPAPLIDAPRDFRNSLHSSHGHPQGPHYRCRQKST